MLLDKLNRSKLLGIIIFMIATGLLLSSKGNPVVTRYIQENMLMGAIVYFLFMIISVIFIALPVIPLWPLAIITYGLVPAILLTILGVNIGAFISFTIGRVWGKDLVIKLVGKKTFKKLEGTFRLDRPLNFFLVRLFSNNAYDLVSYLAGLSKLKAYSYVIITLIVSTFWISVIFIILNAVINVNLFLVSIAVLITYVLAIGINWFYLKFITRSKK